MRVTEVAYLGPEGTYSHQVAEKRYGPRIKLVPRPSVVDVFAYVGRKACRHAVVPIENSSGGTVYETVDVLLSGKYDLRIDEQIDINVKLALLGRKGQKIRALYSHFAPLAHCDTWLRKHLPGVERHEVASTAIAAREAAAQQNAAAIGSKMASQIYRLDVLAFPLEQDIPNVTQFFTLSRGGRRLPGATRTSLAVNLANKPGSLCSFLVPFRDCSVNLCRIVSRPIPARPKEYAFFVDIEGTPADKRVKAAMNWATATGAHLRVLGSYPVRVLELG